MVWFKGNAWLRLEIMFFDQNIEVSGFNSPIIEFGENDKKKEYIL